MGLDDNWADSSVRRICRSNRSSPATKSTITLSICIAVIAMPSNAGNSVTAWGNHQAAMVVLGQPDFTTTGGSSNASVASAVKSVAVDPISAKVFVCNGHRILRFTSAAALANGSAAEAVLGQPTLLALAGNQGGNPAANTLLGPSQIMVDSSGRLWVADSGNNRVLRFDNASTKATNANADAVLGQLNFTSAQPNRGGNAAQATLSTPNGVWMDGLGLWVSDFDNNRVLGFALPVLKANGASADAVLGQPDFLQTATGFTVAGMNHPMQLVTRDGSLYLAEMGNARVLRYDNVDQKSNGASADAIINVNVGLQPAPPQYIFGVAADFQGRLYVADGYNNRIVIINDAATRSGPSGDAVLGQSDFTTKAPGLDAQSFNVPRGVVFDDTTRALWVADENNGRALRFTPVVNVLDVDNSSPSATYSALTDGLLVLRYLFGATGNALTQSVTSPGAKRSDPVQVREYLEGIRTFLDIDGDGIVSPLTDGLLILRYLFGLHDTALTSGVIGPNATRTDAATIEPYIDSLMP